MSPMNIAAVLLVSLALVPLAWAQGKAQETSTVATTGAEVARTATAKPDDPRVCLEFATNLQVIVCAEKYRPHRRSS